VVKEGTVWRDLEFLERALEGATNDETRERFATFVKLARIGISESLEKEFVRGNVSTSTYRNILGSEPSIDLMRGRLKPHQVKVGPDYSEFAFKALAFLNDRAQRA
jgi:hypothetical protein